jgi:condensin complex subunit 3
VYEDISLAVDDKKMALDATGRNSLYKIHVSLGKIVNSLNEKDKDGAKEKGRGSRKSSVTPSVLAGGDEEDAEDDVGEKTELIKTVEEAEDTIVVDVTGRGTRDSLVDELLSDGDGEGDIEMSGM